MCTMLGACCKTQLNLCFPFLLWDHNDYLNLVNMTNNEIHYTHCYNWARALCFCLSLHIVSYRTTSFIQKSWFPKETYWWFQEGCMSEQNTLSLCIKQTKRVFHGKDLTWKRLQTSQVKNLKATALAPWCWTPRTPKRMQPGWLSVQL